MVFKCQHCSFCSDDTEEMVCPSCGIVFQEVDIEETIAYAERASKKWTSYKSSKQNSRTPMGQRMGLNMIKTLTSLYHVTSEMALKATNMFHTAYASKRFHTIDDSRTLAGCCFYIVLRENNYPVLISDLCPQIQCKIHRFNSIYKRIQHSGNADIVPQQAQDLVANVLNGMPEEGKQQLFEKTKSLIALCQSCWLSSGRSARNLVIASAYICWKSIDPRRLTQTFKNFCSDYNFSEPQSKARLQEVQSLLVKLAANISSPDSCKITKRNVSCFLDYILSHSESLRNDLLSQEHTNEDIEKKEFNMFRKQPKVRKSFEKQNEDVADINASDVEISDSEISEYLRTDEEIAAIQKIHEPTVGGVSV